MSGMFDTKTDKAKRKQELTMKEQKSRRKRNIITVSVTVVFLLAVGAAVLLNSNWLRRTLPVVTIDDVGFSTAEFEYFFKSEFMNIASIYEEQGLGFILPDQNRSMSSQIYDSETGETWADLITERTLSTLQELTSVYKAAQADGFVLPEERLDEIENEIEINGFYAQMYGYPSLESYLQLIYGAGMNTDLLRDILIFIATAQEYSIHMRNSLVYTDEQLDAYYAENADDFDIFKYRVFIINADEYDDGNDDTAAHEQAIAGAREAAKLVADNIDSEESFITAAMNYDDVMYGGPDSTVREVQGRELNNAGYNDYYIAWLKETGRAYGDTTTIDLPQGTAVLYFLERDNNSYETVGMRQILISRESVSPDDYPDGESDPGYIQALEEAAAEASIRAQLVDRLYTDAGRTEEALISLMEEHSDDTTHEGLYEGISKYPYQGVDFYSMRVVPELEQWLFDEGRNKGDSQLIESEAYGYHLIFFTGYYDVFSRVIAEDNLRTIDNTQWLDSIPLSEPVIHGAFILVTL